MKDYHTTTVEGAAEHARQACMLHETPITLADVEPGPRPHVHLPMGPGALAQEPLCGVLLTEGEAIAARTGVRRWGWAVTEGRACDECRRAVAHIWQVSR